MSLIKFDENPSTNQILKIPEVKHTSMLLIFELNLDIDELINKYIFVHTLDQIMFLNVTEYSNIKV